MPEASADVGLVPDLSPPADCSGLLEHVLWYGLAAAWAVAIAVTIAVVVPLTHARTKLFHWRRRRRRRGDS